ncbi:hypothetical protein DXG01_005760 [Tephrocybe rancida]|nr:hypothetical protein DXG01_005760 [Tephrocybe rancida]
MITSPIGVPGSHKGSGVDCQDCTFITFTFISGRLTVPSKTRIDSSTSTSFTTPDNSRPTFVTTPLVPTSLITSDASTLTGASTEHHSTAVAPEPSATLPVPQVQPKGVPIGVIAGTSASAAVVILVDSEPVEGIVNKERIDDGSAILQSRSDGVVHNGPQLTEAIPPSNMPRPQHRQRRNHPQTEAQPSQDNDAHILSPVPIHKPVISADEVASPGAPSVSRVDSSQAIDEQPPALDNDTQVLSPAPTHRPAQFASPSGSSVARAENSQGIDEQLVQLSEDQAAMTGAGFQQFYREMAMLRREIGELRRVGADVPPAYPGSIYTE